ncbi:MAG: efflux RND transporter periplasmic adaptor subunit [Fibrobacterota bacterium]
MMNSIILYIFFVIFFWGCASQEDEAQPQSIQDIQDQKGLPVTVEEVQLQSLMKVEEIGATVAGHQQTYVSTAAGGILETIHVAPGDRVHSGQTVATMRFEQGSPIDGAQTAYDHAERSLERIKRLHEEGAASQSELEAVKTQYETAKHSLGQARVAQYIRASFSGTVLDVMEKEGSTVDQRTPVALIADYSRIKMELSASETVYQRLEEGQRVFLQHDADTVWGKLTQLSLSADPMTHSFTATALFPNDDFILRPGMYKHARIVVAQKDNIVVLPFDLIQHDVTGNPYVYVVEDGRAQTRSVEFGMSDGFNYEISDGINAGDSLVYTGTSRLYSDAPVNVVSP